MWTALGSGSPGRRPAGGCRGDWRDKAQAVRGRGFTARAGSKVGGHSQQGLQGAVGLEGVGQVSGAADAGDDAQVEVELSERTRLGDAVTDASEVSVGQLTAADAEQPHAVLQDALTDVLHLGRGQQLTCDLDGGWQHVQAWDAPAGPTCQSHSKAPPPTGGQQALMS